LIHIWGKRQKSVSGEGGKRKKDNGQGVRAHFIWEKKRRGPRIRTKPSHYKERKAAGSLGEKRKILLVGKSRGGRNRSTEDQKKELA